MLGDMCLPISLLLLFILCQLREEDFQVTIPKLVDVSRLQLRKLLLFVLELLLKRSNFLLGQTPESHRQQVIIVLWADLTDTNIVILHFRLLRAVLISFLDDRHCILLRQDFFDL